MRGIFLVFSVILCLCGVQGGKYRVIKLTRDPAIILRRSNTTISSNNVPDENRILSTGFLQALANIKGGGTATTTAAPTLTGTITGTLTGTGTPTGTGTGTGTGTITGTGTGTGNRFSWFRVTKSKSKDGKKPENQKGQKLKETRKGQNSQKSQKKTQAGNKRTTHKPKRERKPELFYVRRPRGD
ncbi:unnamed protein product [Hermetia illucens]|uniref:Uncharacterized protein n=1 Tax=Hermetia illucens TaxID=343691 RepID=A0A7R8V167_HERIL|nr:unnamed protein product [Hermetia illucens]